MARKKRTIALDDVTPEMRQKMGLWIADALHDMEVDAEQIADEQGEDFMPALRGLVEWLRGAK